MQLDEDYTFETDKIEYGSDLQVAVIYYTLFSTMASYNDATDKVNYTLYRPPIPDKDIPVLVQSFLI